MTTNTNAALTEYANPLNWDADANGIRRIWREPGSDTPDAYNGFEMARAALTTAAAPAAVAGPSEFSHEQMDAMALARYKVVPSTSSMIWSHAVVAGDGAQQLYVGREVECQNMVRKFAGAFLDGAFAFHSIAATPTTQQEAAYTSVQLAEMVLSDCGHSSNYKPLLERVAGRIDRHVERLLTAQQAGRALREQAAPAAVAGPSQETCQSCQGNGEIVTNWERYKHPSPGDMGDEAVAECQDCDGRGVVDAAPTTQATPQPAPVAQGDAEDAARLDWLLLRISGAEFRRIGVCYSGNARRADVDAARSQAKEGA